MHGDGDGHGGGDGHGHGHRHDGKHEGGKSAWGCMGMHGDRRLLHTIQAEVPEKVVLFHLNGFGLACKQGGQNGQDE